VVLYATAPLRLRDAFVIADLDDRYTDGLLDIRVRVRNDQPAPGAARASPRSCWTTPAPP